MHEYCVTGCGLTPAHRALDGKVSFFRVFGAGARGNFANFLCCLEKRAKLPAVGDALNVAKGSVPDPEISAVLVSLSE